MVIIVLRSPSKICNHLIFWEIFWLNSQFLVDDFDTVKTVVYYVSRIIKLVFSFLIISISDSTRLQWNQQYRRLTDLSNLISDYVQPPAAHCYPMQDWQSLITPIFYSSLHFRAKRALSDVTVSRYRASGHSWFIVGFW